MRKVIVAAATVFMAISSSAYAQQPTPHPSGELSVKDLNMLTDARIGIVKATLQLTPEQQKFWPAIEDAIRTRGKHRQARLERLAELRNHSPLEIIGQRSPVDFLNKRADILAERSADLRKLAGAWDPLYKTLTAEQKQRLGLLALTVLREVRDAVEERHMQYEYSEDDFE